MEEFYSDIINTRIAACVLLLGFSRAHDFIRESISELGPGPGKTTLVGGILVPNPTVSKEYFFIYVTLGDCKFFHYSTQENILSDLTFGNRKNLTDASDPGGKLGGSELYLNNLDISFKKVKEGDFIIAMSDGVHDNFDPQSVGILPSELNLPDLPWESIDYQKLSQVKGKFTENEILKIINELDDLNPESIVVALTERTRVLTQASRTFMETNPKQKLPADLKEYPGKLDHASCACVKVGSKPSTVDYLGNTFNNSEETRLHEALREKQLSCRLSQQLLAQENQNSNVLTEQKSKRHTTTAWRSTPSNAGNRRALFIGKSFTSTTYRNSKSPHME